MDINISWNLLLYCEKGLRGSVILIYSQYCKYLNSGKCVNYRSKQQQHFQRIRKKYGVLFSVRSYSSIKLYGSWKYHHCNIAVIWLCMMFSNTFFCLLVRIGMCSVIVRYFLNIHSYPRNNRLFIIKLKIDMN